MKKRIDIQSLLEPSDTGLPAEKKDADRPLQWVDRGWYLVMDFEHSSSEKFAQAVETAKANPYFTELADERGVSLFRTIYFKEDFPKFEPLYALVGGWKNTKLYLKGSDIRREVFATWYDCYRRYWGHRKTLNADDFCGASRVNKFPDFIGCYERNIHLRWRDPLYMHYQQSSRLWYTFGRRRDQVYVVDKAAMAAFLARVNEDFIHCPCYGHDRLDRVIHRLPDALRPDTQKEWQFREDYLKLSARGVMMINYDIALSVLPEVCPASEKAYHRFMDKILKQTF